jgi:proteic killer suppression protein
MQISFRTKKLAKQCNSRELLLKVYGERRAKVIMRRLDDLRAATVLDDLRHAPGDLHAYRHRTDHTLTMDLPDGWRLYLRPADSPLPLQADGKTLDWTRTQSFTVVDISNHDL